MRNSEETSWSSFLPWRRDGDEFDFAVEKRGRLVAVGIGMEKTVIGAATIVIVLETVML